MFIKPNNCFLLNSNCSYLLGMRNHQKQVKKAFCYQKLFWPFTVWINCSSDLKTFANSWPSASNFKSSSQSLEHFFLVVVQNKIQFPVGFYIPIVFFNLNYNCSGQNNFGNKIPFMNSMNFFNFDAWIITYSECRNQCQTSKFCRTLDFYLLSLNKSHFNRVW